MPAFAHGRPQKRSRALRRQPGRVAWWRSFQFEVTSPWPSALARTVCRLRARCPGELCFAAFDVHRVEPFDIVLADEWMRIARFPCLERFDLFKRVVVLGVRMNDGVDARLLLDIFEPFGGGDVALAHGLHVRKHLNAFLDDSHEVAADHPANMTPSPVLERRNDR